MLKKILIAIGGLIALFLVVVALQPAAYRVTRSTVIAAPASAAYALVNDFHKWDQWSPWATLDPEMKLAYSGPSEGPGSVYHWTGNSKVGEGEMAITESRPDQLVRIRLEFIKPFPSSTITGFEFKPEGSGTGVTWTMHGDNNFIGKAMCLFVSMDRMVGGDFERGLANLKAAAQKVGGPAKQESLRPGP